MVLEENREVRTQKVRVDFHACKECGYCSLVCLAGVFEKGKEYNARGYQAFTAAYPDRCVGCGRCFYVCPDFAVSLECFSGKEPGR